MDNREILFISMCFTDLLMLFAYLFDSLSVDTHFSRRGRNRVYRKSSWLTRPKDNWPKFGKTGMLNEVTCDRYIGNFLFLIVFFKYIFLI